jgi:hypothetical protein
MDNLFRMTRPPQRLCMTQPPEFILVGLSNTGTRSFMHYMLKAGLKCGLYKFFAAKLDAVNRVRLLSYSDKPEYLQEACEINDDPWFLAIDRCYTCDRTIINQLQPLYKMNFTAPAVLLVRDPAEKVISSINYFLRMIDGTLWELGVDAPMLINNFYLGFESAMYGLLNGDFLNRYMRYSSAIKQLSPRFSGEPIFIDIKDITSPNTINTMKMLAGKFSLTLPDDMAYFTRPVSNHISQILWNDRIFFFPGEKGLNIENPIRVAIHIENISEPYLGANLPLIMEMDQDIIPSGGKAGLYLINNSPRDYEKIVDNQNAHAALSAKAVDYLERLAKYDEWCRNKDNFYSNAEIMNYFKENKKFRESFLTVMEYELEIVYKYAPEIPKNWPYYNELLKM